MVDDDIALVSASQAVALMVCHLSVSEPESHVADDDVVAFDGEGIVGNAYSIARSRLSGNGNAVVPQS
jgi:hypothetical protein